MGKNWPFLDGNVSSNSQPKSFRDPYFTSTYNFRVAEQKQSHSMLYYIPPDNKEGLNVLNNHIFENFHNFWSNIFIRDKNASIRFFGQKFHDFLKIFHGPSVEKRCF